MNKLNEHSDDSEDEDFLCIAGDEDESSFETYSEEDSNSSDYQVDNECNLNIAKKLRKQKIRKTKNKKARNVQKNDLNIKAVDYAAKKIDKNTSKLLTESDDDEKNRGELLWAGFLNDSKSTSNYNKCEQSGISKAKSKSSPTKVTAYANIRKTDEVGKIQSHIKTDKSNNNAIVGMKRPSPLESGASSSRGLGNLLNQIGKKQKLSILDKTKLDWNTFKNSENLQEELKTFNKGKDGYLERQDFLQRSDLQHYETEKNVRHKRRGH